MKKITMPPVLAFDRKLEPSDALMYSGNWGDITNEEAWNEIELFERRNRAVKSNFKQEVLDDEDELQKQIAEGNLSWGDDAALDHEHDTVKIKFTLRMVSGLEKPSVCNKADFNTEYSKNISEYLQPNIGILAKRYAYNIANGRFLWRNRVGAEELKVVVNHPSLSEPLVFDAYHYSLKKTESDDADVMTLAELIKTGLLGEEKVLLTVSGYARLGQGQRVWPSQEMVLNVPKGEKSRHLFYVANGSQRFAAMHCEKIGNALRTIDDWYPRFEEMQAPIAIEAYGSVTQKGEAYRSNKTDFKTLILKWFNSGELSINEKHFVVAMLIRGGVFGEGES